MGMTLPTASPLLKPSRSSRLSAMRGLAASLILATVAAGALSGCAGIKTPDFMKLRAGSSSGKSKLPGERVAVLPDSEGLQPAAALKGVGYSLPEPHAQPNWPQAGGPPEAVIDHVIAAPAMEIAWRRNIGVRASEKGYLTAQPIVADGRLYVMDAQATVSCLDAKSGSPVWRVNLGEKKGNDRDAYGGGLAFEGGKLFVTSGYRFVAALNPATGAILWRRRVDTPVHGAPSVLDGRVYATDVDDQLLTFNAADGSPGWTYQALQEPARMLVASTVAINGDVAVAPFASGELTALNTANGSELWSYVLSLTNRNNALSEIRDIAGRPVIYRGDVLAGSHSGVFAAVDLRSGQPRWSLPIATIDTPWPANDVVFVTGQNGELVCISREAGQVYWIADLNKGKKPKEKAAWSGPILASGRLITVSDRGEVKALDPKTGDLKRTLNLRVKQGATLAPTPADGMLYIATQSGEIIALR